MKILIFCLLTSTAFGQVKIENGNLDIYTDSTVSAKSAKLIFDRFELGNGIKIYDRYIYSKNATYYRPGIGVFRKPRIYLVEDSRLIKLDRDQF